MPNRSLILLHGLGRTKLSMAHLGFSMRKLGFDIYNFGYCSIRRDINTTSKHLGEFIQKRVPPDSELYFVTHSLGSIILRQFASNAPIHTNFKRAVMLGPPNQGSSFARKVRQIRILERVLGPAFRELCDLNIPAATDRLEIGIISGGQGSNKGYSPFFSEDNDGIVSVEETKLSGSKDWILIPCLHSFLMYSPSAIREIGHFLLEGRFTRQYGTN